MRFLPLHDYQGQDGDTHRAVSRLTGKTCRVHLRRAPVDARYLEVVIPAHRPPPFAVAPGMRVIPPNALAARRDDPELKAAMEMIAEHRNAALDSLRRLTAMQGQSKAHMKPDADQENTQRFNWRE